jgi:hypothetical protein
MVLSQPFALERAVKPADGTTPTGNTKDAALRWDLEKDAYAIDPQSVPYLYVEGALSFSGTTKTVNTLCEKGYGKEDTPFNIFCASLDLQPQYLNDDGINYTESAPMTIIGNMYMYDENATNTFKVYGNSTKLKKWVGKVVGGTSADSGSIYCKGNLELSCFDIDGDVCVDGNLIVDKIKNNGDLNITGNLKVGGMIETKNGAKINVTKKCICDGYVGTSKSDITATEGIEKSTERGTKEIASSATTKPSMKAGYTYEFSNEVTVSHNVEVNKTKPYKFAVFDPSGNVVFKDENTSWDTAVIEGTTLWGNSYKNWKVPGAPDPLPVAGCTIKRNVNLPTEEKETVALLIKDASGKEIYRDKATDHTLTLECDGRLYEGTKSFIKGADVTYKDSTDTVVSQAEAMNIGATSFFDASGAPIPRITYMPVEYEKASILGTTGDPAKAKYKFIKTVPEILNSSADPYNNTYTDVPGTHKAACEAAANVFTDSGAALTVDKDCTLKGGFSGRDITIVAPKAKDSPEGIWVVLDNFNLNGGSIVIDDETNLEGGKIGAVNFMVRGACGVSASSSKGMCGYFCTTSIAKKLNDTNSYQIYTDDSYGIGTFTTSTDKDGNTVTKLTPTVERIDPPNVFMYSAETGASFAVQNDQTLSIMMKAPYLDYDQQCSGGVSLGGKTGKLFYNGFDISKAPATQLGNIGCVICHDFQCGNNWLLLFAGNEGSSGKKSYDDALLNSWTIMYDDFC